jgi:tungstate transport system substrate-binding protein
VPPSLQGCLAVLLCALSGAACARQDLAEPLVLATTTSVGNSGLLDALAPAFQRAHGRTFRSHLVGSGLALRMLATGDADLVISHAPEAEAEALRTHRDWRYQKVMFNDFVLVGPASDPGGVGQAGDASDAMRRIAGSTARFISRGDQSGTHEREEALWQSAGIRPPAGRLVVAGAAMGATLRIASETESYSLSDRGTFLRLANSLRLVVVYDGGVDLLNTYAVITDTDGAHAGDAQRFSDWLGHGGGRQVVESYTVDGRQLFFAWPEGRPSSRPGAVPR